MTYRRQKYFASKPSAIPRWILLFLFLEVGVVFCFMTMALHQQASSQSKERLLASQYSDNDLLVTPVKVEKGINLEEEELSQLEASFGGSYELDTLNRADVLTDDGIQEVWVLWTTRIPKGKAFVGEAVESFVQDGIQLSNVFAQLKGAELILNQQHLTIGENPFDERESVLFFNLLQGVPIERLVVMPYYGQVVRNMPFSNHVLIVRLDSPWQQVTVNDFLRELHNMTGELYHAVPVLAMYRKIVTDNHVTSIYFSRIAWLLTVQLLVVFPMFTMWHLNRVTRDIAIKRVFGARFVPLVLESIRPILMPLVFGWLGGMALGSAVIFYSSMIEAMPVIPHHVTSIGIVIPFVVGIMLSAIIVVHAGRKIYDMSLHLALIEGSSS